MNKRADDRFFCSDVSQNLDEPLLATAGPKRLWILLQDHSAWGVKAFDECDLSEQTKAYLKGLFTDQAPNIVLIRNSADKQLDKKALFVVHADEREPSIYQYDWRSEDDLYDLPLVDAVNKTLPANTFEALYLICTNGKRDKCCAKYGMPLYNELKPLLGRQVWQSSHLGGDRFAANLLCLPHGVLYGRMGLDLAQKAIIAYEKGLLSLDGLRGRACYSKPVQAAEYYLREAQKIERLDELVLQSVVQADTLFTVVFDVAGKSFDLCLKQSFQEPSRKLTCRAEEDSIVPVYTLQSLTNHSA